MYLLLSPPHFEEVHHFIPRFEEYIIMEKIALKELREWKGISQMQLAEEIGVNHRTISQYENGTREPDIQTIKKLCKYLGVTAGQLIGTEDI